MSTKSSRATQASGCTAASLLPAAHGSETWETLRAEMLRRIDAIDKATPWRETEPRWWLQMMDVRAEMLKSPNEKLTDAP